MTHKVHAMVAAARAAGRHDSRAWRRSGFELTHVYGLTETYGPAAVCAEAGRVGGARYRAARRAQWAAGRALRARGGMTVLDPETMAPGSVGRPDHRRDHVPREHHDEGIPEESRRRPAEAFAGGWFHSGDLAVVHPDGYVKIRDRAKDVIISGGENISSLEVEDAIYHHPAVVWPCRRRAAGSEMGRDAVRVHRAQGRRGRHGERHHRALPRAAARLQGTEDRGLRSSRRRRRARSRSMSCGSAPARPPRSSRSRSWPRR